jgi:hypothetical protein
MTDEELAAERYLLECEQAELRAAHKVLQANRHDAVGHAAHSKRLHAHIDRLRAYAEAVRTHQAKQRRE